MLVFGGGMCGCLHGHKGVTISGICFCTSCVKNGAGSVFFFVKHKRTRTLWLVNVDALRLSMCCLPMKIQLEDSQKVWLVPAVLGVVELKTLEVHDVMIYAIREIGGGGVDGFTKS